MRLMELSNKALTFAKKVLKPGGNFICKASTGGEEQLFKMRLQRLFEEVKFIKPDSSFKDSTEIFIVAQNYQKIARPVEPEEELEVPLPTGNVAAPSHTEMPSATTIIAKSSPAVAPSTVHALIDEQTSIVQATAAVPSAKATKAKRPPTKKTSKVKK